MSLKPAVLRVRSPLWSATWVVCVAAALAVGVHAQKSAPTIPRTGGSIGSGSASVPRSGNGNGVPFGDVPESESDLRVENLRNRAREADRQKRMVDDANRLVVLAARYRASISEHGSATAEDARLLMEMEKLARSVKDRMRGM